MSSVVFVNPPLTLSDRYGLRFQSGGQTPPLGLANLAAMTRQCGITTAILDAAALQLTHEEAAEQIASRGYRYVGLTAVTISVAHAAKVAGLVKMKNSEATTIIGGPHLSALPEETMQRFPEFDIGVIGEADHTIVDLIRALDSGGDLSQVPGLILRGKEGGFQLTGSRCRINDLDSLPMPAWDLLPDLARHYCPPVHTLRRIPAGMLVASRGCPGHCGFCSRNVFGSVMRAFSAGHTFKMMKELRVRYGLREIQLRDDNFVAYKDRMRDLCKLIIEERLDIIWTCAARVDMVDSGSLALMKKAGCWQIWYGIESGSQRILDRMMKQTTLAQVDEACRLTSLAGISPCGFFILGYPGETTESMQETIDLALRLPLGDAQFGFFTPLPGAEIYSHAREFGACTADWSKLHGWIPTFVPHGLSVTDLERFANKAFKAFYFRPRIIASYLGRIRSARHAWIYLNGFLALLEYLFKHKAKAAGTMRD